MYGALWSRAVKCQLWGSWSYHQADKKTSSGTRNYRNRVPQGRRKVNTTPSTVIQESEIWGLKVVHKLPVGLRGSGLRLELSSGLLPARSWDALLLLPLTGALTPAAVLLPPLLPFDSLPIIFLSYFCFKTFSSILHLDTFCCPLIPLVIYITRWPSTPGFLLGL